jgi:hypothetical protein
MKRAAAVVALLFLTQLSLASERRQPMPWREQGPAMILHPVGPLTEADRAELEAKGVYVKHALSGGRYLVRMATGTRVADARIVSVEPLSARMKLHASALHEASRGATWARLNVIFQRDVSFEDAREALLAAGAAMADPFATTFAPSHRLVVKLSPGSIDALAADDRVLAIAGPRRFRVESDNASTAALSHVTELYSAPYNLTGAE